MADQKTFPAPRLRDASTPYRKPGVPAPLAGHAPKVEVHEANRPPPPRDVFDELAKVEVDPRAVAERRSADRFWGIVFLIAGIGAIFITAGFDWETIFSGGRGPFKMLVSLHCFTVFAIVIGIIKLRSRGLDEP